MTAPARSAVAIALAVVVGAAVGWAGSDHGAKVGGVAVFASCAVVAFALNWIAFVPAYLARTERFYDITGSITYLALVAGGLVLGSGDRPRALVLGCLVGIWTIRLGSFLFRRIAQDGTDGRFDEIKTDALAFLSTWTIQGLWVLVTVSCALAVMTGRTNVPLDWQAAVGALIWAGGFGLEVVADRQKRSFRANPANTGRFINTGTWAWSRHPNYFGEITLWFGIALIALPALRGWQFVTLVSPVFVLVLITRISGIPLLEARAAKKWAGDPSYDAYVAATPVLVPRPPPSRAPLAN